MIWILEAYLPEEVPSETLRIALANGLGITVDRVGVERDGNASGCDYAALAMRVTTAAPDDPVFPYTIRMFAVGAVSDKLELARGMSASLGLAMVVDAGPPDLEDDWMLVLPNGNYRLVTVNDDESFALNPYDLNEISRTRSTVRRAA